MADETVPVPDPDPVPAPPSPTGAADGSTAPTAGAEAAPTDADFDPGAAAFEPVDATAAGGSTPAIDDAALQELLNLASMESPAGNAGAGASEAAGVDSQQFELPNFQQVIDDAAASSIDLLRDVDLNVKIELGRSRMLVEEVLRLTEGSVVELDKLAGDPVDVFVNERLVARGEVLVLNDNFCVRVNEIVAAATDEQS